MAKNIDWLAIKNEYISTNTSYRKLAEKYGISFSALEKTARKEQWKKLREEQCDKIATKVRQKTAEKIAEGEANRVVELLDLVDDAMSKIADALEQPDNRIDKFGVVHPCEILDVDRLRKLVAALKDVKDILHEDTAKEVNNGILDELAEYLKSEN